MFSIFFGRINSATWTRDSFPGRERWWIWPDWHQTHTQARYQLFFFCLFFFLRLKRNGEQMQKQKKSSSVKFSSSSQAALVERRFPMVKDVVSDLYTWVNREEQWRGGDTLKGPDGVKAMGLTERERVRCVRDPWICYSSSLRSSASLN